MYSMTHPQQKKTTFFKTKYIPMTEPRCTERFLNLYSCLNKREQKLLKILILQSRDLIFAFPKEHKKADVYCKPFSFPLLKEVTLRAKTTFSRESMRRELSGLVGGGWSFPSTSFPFQELPPEFVSFISSLPYPRTIVLIQQLWCEGKELW